jgi:enoyl-CoA hydratase
MPGTVLVTTPRPGVTQLTLNRPASLNAMTTELIEDLHGALDAVGADAACRVVVLTGEGRGFCSGLDLRGYGAAPGSDGLGGKAAGMAIQHHIARLISHFRATRQPIVAAVNGPATGGGLALVLGSDIRFASSSARFGAAFVRIGLSACDIGTSWLLPRIVGAGRAHEMMLTGRIIDAAEAERIGLVIEVVPEDALLERAYAEADLIIANSPFGVWMTKEGMWAALEIPGQQAAMDLENRTQIMISGGADQREAMTAFLEKRPPSYTFDR